MKSKRGFLLASETLKIVIAVICIGFLVYFLVSLYLTSKSSKDLEFAKESLSYLVDEIKGGKIEIEIYNPKNWVIGIWPHEVDVGGVFGIWTTREERIPKSCSNIGWENCICICKSDNPDECDNNGVCLENTFEIDIENKSIQISKVPFTIEIKDNVIIKE